MAFPPGCLPPLPLLPHSGDTFTRDEMTAYAVAFAQQVESHPDPDRYSKEITILAGRELVRATLDEFLAKP